jgi:hypothetical protein
VLKYLKSTIERTFTQAELGPYVVSDQKYECHPDVADDLMLWDADAAPREVPVG